LTNANRYQQMTQAIYLDATVIATHCSAALRALDEQTAGWPSSTHGASPAVGGNPGTYDPEGRVALTTVERDAGQRDIARRNMEELTNKLAQLQRDTARVAALCVRWGMPGVDGTSVTKRLVSIDQDIWCRNCSRHGQKNPRAEARTECTFCSEFRQDFGTNATAAIMSARDARGGRLSITDIERILDRDEPGWRRKRPKPKTKAVKPAESKQ
jgi:hypothetical protein